MKKSKRVLPVDDQFCRGEQRLDSLSVTASMKTRCVPQDTHLRSMFLAVLLAVVWLLHLSRCTDLGAGQEVKSHQKS